MPGHAGAAETGSPRGDQTGDIVDAEYEILAGRGAATDAHQEAAPATLCPGLAVLRRDGAGERRFVTGSAAFWVVAILLTSSAFWISGGHALSAIW
ncbi:hypothetical protein [Chelativorans sp.]|uniref:hypothetical protein n=1 Tax=Chelativorans sp. TaxID=2203393 RepID=UPI0028115DF6|nr:hypothetical protein [Chelativorans sp.]